MTKPQSGAAASMLPDDMVSGGLADDFDGVVREARIIDNWDYAGTRDELTLAVRLKFERTDLPADADPDDKVVVEHYSCGDLKYFKPGMTLAEGEFSTPEGVYFKPVAGGALKNSTKFAQLTRSLLDAQVPKERFALDIRFIEGIKGHWNRLPPDRKPGQFRNRGDGEQKKPSDTLCLTRFDGIDAAGKANGRAGAPTPSAPSAATAQSSDLDAKVAAIVVAGLKPGAAVKKTALSGMVLKGWDKADKAGANKAVKRVVDNEFLEGLVEHSIIFDADAGTVELVGE